MSSYRTVAATTALALFMIAAAPAPYLFGPAPAAAQNANQILADKTPLSSMDKWALNARIKALRKLIQSSDLTKAQKQDARTKMKQAQAELKARRAAEKKATGNQQNQAQQTQEKQEKQQTQQAQQKQQKQQNQLAQKTQPQSPLLQAIIRDRRPLDKLSDAELRARVRAGMEARKAGNLTPADKQAINRFVPQARAELKKRRLAKQQAQQAQQKQQKQQKQQAQKTAPQSPQLQAIIQDHRPLDKLSDAELRARIKVGMEARKAGNLTPADKQAINRFVPQARAELKKRRTATQNAGSQTNKNNNAQAMQPKLHADAMRILADKRPAARLSKQQLRQRLNKTRALLADKSLQPRTRQQLRIVLINDRKELRHRVATDNRNQTTVVGTPVFDNSGKSTIVIGINTPVLQIIQRRTPSDRLNERDLNRRIRLLEQARREHRLHGRDLQIAQQIIISDRQALRHRLMADRERRRMYFREHNKKFKLGINVVVAPRYDIAAAEADPTQLQDQLVAAPRWKPQRAYSINEIMHDDNLRRAMPGIEIDTVTFDSGSAELAPEMIDELANVATVMEKILAIRPNEVFLIEGHTDAVGSPQSNQVLSEARAQSVEQALVDYFAVDPSNLHTVGLGERFLKIPTQGPEQENRRVTIRRITPLLTGQVN